MSNLNHVKIKNSTGYDAWVVVSSDKVYVTEEHDASFSSDYNRSDRAIGMSHGQSVEVGYKGLSAGTSSNDSFNFSKSDITKTVRASASGKKFQINAGPATGGRLLKNNAAQDFPIDGKAEMFYLAFASNGVTYSYDSYFDVVSQDHVELKPDRVLDTTSPRSTLLLNVSIVSMAFGGKYVSTPVVSKNWPAANVGDFASKHAVLRVPESA
jgi:hypothetical protein